MECTEILIIASFVVFLLGDFVVMLYATYGHYDKKPHYLIIFTAFTSSTIVLGLQMFSVCHMAYCVWGAITSGLLFCFFISETFDNCMPLCLPTCMPTVDAGVV